MLLVTRNAPDQDLWNGDIGLIDETTSGLRALFPDGHGGVRSLSAGRLPSHESAVAMSVHKSQGSEFDEVDLVLGDRSSPIMTRELFYTGVTRAREAIRVFASAPAIRAMMARRIVRELRRQYLDRNLALQRTVPRPVDLSHAADAEAVADLISLESVTR